ncbi:MAG: hypothetical protein H8E13_00015 [Actinobacteria bacterium]|nr:hypothetical protein [Actinomycetota bacterium]
MNNKNIEYKKEDNFKFLPMATVVGIKLNEGIVIGSDSQLTEGESKELGYKKIHMIGNVLFSGAGDTDYILKVKQELEKNYSGKLFQNQNEVTSLFETTIKSINRNYGFKKDMYSEFIFGININVNNKVVFYLYRIDNYHKFALEIPNYYTIGSGGVFAKYILKRMWKDTLNIVDGLKLTIYIISEVKTIDQYTSSPINIASLSNKGYTFYPDELIRRAESFLSTNDEKTKKFFRELILNPDMIEVSERNIEFKKLE